MRSAQAFACMALHRWGCVAGTGRFGVGPASAACCDTILIYSLMRFSRRLSLRQRSGSSASRCTEELLLWASPLCFTAGAAAAASSFVVDEPINPSWHGACRHVSNMMARAVCCVHPVSALAHEAISLACDRWIPPGLNLVACPCGGVHALVSKDIMLKYTHWYQKISRYHAE